MKNFIHRGIVLEYEDIGEGRPFVFLHGLGGSIKQIESVYDPIDQVRLITLNQQGHGGSGADWETFGFDRLGDDVIALLDELGIDTAVFGGISMGAAVSLNIAVRYPNRVEKLLLIRNAWTDQPMSEEVQTAFADMGRSLKSGGVSAFRRTRGWEIAEGTSSDYTKNAFLSPFDDAACIKNWEKYLILPGQAPVRDLSDIQKLTMPVTIIACRNDLCHPFAYGTYLAEQIPHAEFVEIPDKDTDSLTHNRKINEVIRQVLKS